MPLFQPRFLKSKLLTVKYYWKIKGAIIYTVYISEVFNISKLNKNQQILNQCLVISDKKGQDVRGKSN